MNRLRGSSPVERLESCFDIHVYSFLVVTSFGPAAGSKTPDPPYYIEPHFFFMFGFPVIPVLSMLLFCFLKV